MRTYCDVPTTTNISSSLYNVHEPPANGGVYGMTRSDHAPVASVNNHHAVMQQRLNQRFPTNVSSQSESNLPNLHNYSPNNFRQYNRLGELICASCIFFLIVAFLEPNSTSSSNESVMSSASRDGNNYLGHMSPEKTKRSNIGLSYPKGYRSPGNV